MQNDQIILRGSSVHQGEFPPAGFFFSARLIDPLLQRSALVALPGSLPVFLVTLGNDPLPTSRRDFDLHLERPLFPHLPPFSPSYSSHSLAPRYLCLLGDVPPTTVGFDFVLLRNTPSHAMNSSRRNVRLAPLPRRPIHDGLPSSHPRCHPQAPHTTPSTPVTRVSQSSPAQVSNMLITEGTDDTSCATPDPALYPTPLDWPALGDLILRRLHFDTEHEARRSPRESGTVLDEPHQLSAIVTPSFPTMLPLHTHTATSSSAGLGRRWRWDLWGLLGLPASIAKRSPSTPTALSLTAAAALRTAFHLKSPVRCSNNNIVTNHPPPLHVSSVLADAQRPSGHDQSPRALSRFAVFWIPGSSSCSSDSAGILGIWDLVELDQWQLWRWFASICKGHKAALRLYGCSYQYSRPCDGNPIILDSLRGLTAQYDEVNYPKAECRVSSSCNPICRRLRHACLTNLQQNDRTCVCAETVSAKFIYDDSLDLLLHHSRESALLTTDLEHLTRAISLLLWVFSVRVYCRPNAHFTVLRCRANNQASRFHLVHRTGDQMVSNPTPWGLLVYHIILVLNRPHPAAQIMRRLIPLKPDCKDSITTLLLTFLYAFLDRRSSRATIRRLAVGRPYQEWQIIRNISLTIYRVLDDSLATVRMCAYVPLFGPDSRCEYGTDWVTSSPVEPKEGNLHPICKGPKSGLSSSIYGSPFVSWNYVLQQQQLEFSSVARLGGVCQRSSMFCRRNVGHGMDMRMSPCGDVRTLLTYPVYEESQSSTRHIFELKDTHLSARAPMSCHCSAYWQCRSCQIKGKISRGIAGVATLQAGIYAPPQTLLVTSIFGSGFNDVSFAVRVYTALFPVLRRPRSANRKSIRVEYHVGTTTSQNGVD
ncbi:uncharacterized protein CLUP02_15208 [Colletotrichum lupini]|uniref:Uncharacterized protein n=1 Tax=Colletotrichum lupini TaxID=145971 RepID=A0A9Q8WNS8_9PEZI|nr:uncharacterized protein CLUP02_15208 [Colletotrichum lupini]UQC89677.1 hypothetical protein CLUP02_15208 [Colletotrichum lupini]